MSISKQNKEKKIFPNKSFQDDEFKKVFEELYYNSSLTEHEAYREALKHFARLENAKCRLI